MGARVILCTISMLSGQRIINCGFTTLVPVQTVIIDEASQIEVGDYLPILAKHKKTLRKMVFIGDDKQRKCWVGLNENVTCRRYTHIVPPYGEEQIPELRSVFEWPHLNVDAVFLDIQCMFLPPKVEHDVNRFPWQIGCQRSSETLSPDTFTLRNY